MVAARRARAGVRSATLRVSLAGILNEVGLGPPVGARDERPWLCPAERRGGGAEPRRGVSLTCFLGVEIQSPEEVVTVDKSPSSHNVTLEAIRK
jgi:hypothetical protein